MKKHEAGRLLSAGLMLTLPASAVNQESGAVRGGPVPFPPIPPDPPGQA